MELLPSLLSWIDNAKRTIAQNFQDLATSKEGEKVNLEPGVVPRPRLFPKIDETSEEYRKRQEATYWNEATNNMLGAGIFRPVKSTLDPTTAVQFIKNEIPKMIPSGLNLLPKKFIADYGTENFPLDKYLLHSQDTPDGTHLKRLLERAKTDYKDSLNNEKLTAKRYSRNFDEKYSSNLGRIPDYYKPDLESLVADLNSPTEAELRRVKQAFMQKTNVGKTLKYFNDMARLQEIPLYTPVSQDVVKDFNYAFNEILTPFEEHGIPIDSLKGKSLDSILKKREQLVTKALLDKENYLSNLAEYSKKRNAEQGLPEGWVRLDTRQDRAMDTEILNHCVGSGTTDANGRFLPAVNPLTGKPNLSDAELKRFNQGENYYGPAVEGGFKTIYSYRPKGLPVVTIEMARYKGGYPRQKIIQVAGENNRNLSKDEFQQILPSFKNTLKKDGMQLDDINNIIEIYLNSR